MNISHLLIAIIAFAGGWSLGFIRGQISELKRNIEWMKELENSVDNHSSSV